MPTRKELDHQFRMRLLQVISVGWDRLVQLLCFLIFCTTAYFCIRELAGRQTFADLSFKVIADLKANRWMALSVPWGVATISTAWGAGERYLRKRHIKRVSSEASEMQKMLDPGRRSSSLNKKGETRPEDY
jgi:hypothetical protein